MLCDGFHIGVFVVVKMVDGKAAGTAEERQASYGHHNRWQGGKMPEKQERFMLEWCMVYPRPMTQLQWAEENGVSVRTVQNWLSDPRFKQAWREAADNAYASPEWTQPVVAETYRLALNAPDKEGRREATYSEQLKAIDQFARFVNMTTPTEVRHTVVPADQQLAAMSESDLLAIASGIGADVIEVEGEEIDYDEQ